MGKRLEGTINVMKQVVKILSTYCLLVFMAQVEFYGGENDEKTKNERDKTWLNTWMNFVL